MNENKKYIITIALLSIIICAGVVFGIYLIRSVKDTKNKDINSNTLTEKEALEIGEKLYAEAYNFTTNGLITINDKNNLIVIDDSDHKIIWSSDKENAYNEQINFINNFGKIFADNIQLEEIFTIKDSENNSRLSGEIALLINGSDYYVDYDDSTCVKLNVTDFVMSVKEISEKEIIYNVSYKTTYPNNEDTTNPIINSYEQEFVIIYENDSWNVFKITLIPACANVEMKTIS